MVVVIVIIIVVIVVSMMVFLMIKNPSLTHDLKKSDSGYIHTDTHTDTSIIYSIYCKFVIFGFSYYIVKKEALFL